MEKEGARKEGGSYGGRAVFGSCEYYLMFNNYFY